VDVVEALVAAGADLNKVDQNGATPIMMAAKNESSGGRRLEHPKKQ
jgi:ankyrin repeat protein